MSDRSSAEPRHELGRRRLFQLAGLVGAAALTALETATEQIAWGWIHHSLRREPLPPFDRSMTPPARSARFWRDHLEVVGHGLAPGRHLTSRRDVAEARRRGATTFDTDTQFDAAGAGWIEHSRINAYGTVQGLPTFAAHMLGLQRLDDLYQDLGPDQTLALDVKKALTIGDSKPFGDEREAMYCVVRMLRENPERIPFTCVWLNEPANVLELTNLLRDFPTPDSPQLRVGLSQTKDTALGTEALINEARTCGANAVSLNLNGLVQAGDAQARSLVRKAHAFGLYVYCWDLDKTPQWQQNYERAAIAGVDAITVDRISAAADLSNRLAASDRDLADLKLTGPIR